MLLRRYKWNIKKIFEVYFNDSNKVLIDAGICINPVSEEKLKKEKISNKIIECGICMQDVKISDTFNLECGHINTSKNCWIDYLKYAVKTKDCLFLTCPTYKCSVIIQSDIWKILLGDKYPNEYQRHLRFCNANFIDVF